MPGLRPYLERDVTVASVCSIASARSARERNALRGLSHGACGARHRLRLCRRAARRDDRERGAGAYRGRSRDERDGPAMGGGRIYAGVCGGDAVSGRDRGSARRAAGVSYDCAIDVDSHASNIGVEWKVLALRSGEWSPLTGLAPGLHALSSNSARGAIDYIRDPRLRPNLGCVFVMLPDAVTWRLMALAELAASSWQQGNHQQATEPWRASWRRTPPSACLGSRFARGTAYTTFTRIKAIRSAPNGRLKTASGKMAGPSSSARTARCWRLSASSDRSPMRPTTRGTLSRRRPSA
jgi:hypothetical protein